MPEPDLQTKLEEATTTLLGMLERGEVEIKSGKDWAEVWKALRGEHARLLGQPTTTTRHELDITQVVEKLAALRDGREANGRKAIEASVVDG